MTFPRDLYSKRSAEVLYGSERVYPKNADPIAVSSANSDWGEGASTQIAAAGVITEPFVVVGAHVSDAVEGSNTGWHQLTIYQGAGDEIVAQATFYFNGATRPGINLRFHGALGQGDPIPAGARVHASLSYEAGAATGVSVLDVGISYVEVTE